MEKKSGVVIGKFLPPHQGHSALVDFAASHVDDLYVIVCDQPAYGISGELRQRWLQEIHPNARVLLIDERHAAEDSRGWAERTREVLGFAPTCVFTSEDYGDAYAHFLGSRHVPFDKARAKVPVSGTAVRRDPYANWDFLHPVVRSHFTKRIAFVGAESCGKTTLAVALAKHFQTFIVPEYGRFYWDAKQHSHWVPAWTTPEFVHIAAEQNRVEDYYARLANKVLLCDTNAFLTTIWHRRYLGCYAPEVDALARNRAYDLVFFCDAGIPFVQDGTRDGELIRPEMARWVQDRLNDWGVTHQTLRGTVEARLAAALASINQLFVPPVQA